MGNPYSLDDPVDSLSDNENEYQDAFDDFGESDDIDAQNIYKQKESIVADIKAEEHLEFNGEIIKIRQSRVKAPMVKRAISSILSSREVYFYFIIC